MMCTCVIIWRLGWSLLWLCYSACSLLHIKTCNFVMFKKKSNLCPSLDAVQSVVLLCLKPIFLFINGAKHV